MSELKGYSTIAGEAVADSGGKAFQAINPATGRQLQPTYRAATAAQVAASSTAAAAAFERYRNVPPKVRANFLRAIAANIEAIVDDLVTRIGQETALPEPRVRGETGRTSNQLRLFAAMLEEGSWVDARVETALPDRQPVPRPDLRSMLRPLGPVAVFGASNFPLAYSVAGGDTASALAAGCPVVVKAHPGHPGTSELVGQAIDAAIKSTGMPAGVFSLLFDAGIEVGEQLVQHPSIKAVGFTGSLTGGRALFDLASRRPEPIPVYAEMGSINPIFVLPRALATRGRAIAEGLHQSVSQGAGQFCTKPGVVLVDGNSEFRARLTELMQGTPAATMLHGGIAGNYARGVTRLNQHTSVQALVSPHESAAGATANAGLFETDVPAFLANDELAAEVFGPATLLVKYGSMDELVAVARRLQGQLTVSIHGEPSDLESAAELVSVLEARAGRLVFNGFPTGVEVGDAIVHGGPYPATTDSRTTSVGSRAILRFVRPVCYQNFPANSLPPELRNENPFRICRMVDGKLEVPS